MGVSRDPWWADGGRGAGVTTVSTGALAARPCQAYAYGVDERVERRTALCCSWRRRQYCDLHVWPRSHHLHGSNSSSARSRRQHGPAAAATTLGEDMDVDEALCRLRTLSVLAPLVSPFVCVRLEPILALWSICHHLEAQDTIELFGAVWSQVVRTVVSISSMFIEIRTQQDMRRVHVRLDRVEH